MTPAIFCNSSCGKVLLFLNLSSELSTDDDPDDARSTKKKFLGRKFLCFELYQLQKGRSRHGLRASPSICEAWPSCGDQPNKTEESSGQGYEACVH